jgi:repressor LexA
MSENIRPTKKQREVLRFIETFISEHGYSPSYREIRSGLQYNSIATVALHVNNLIARGHLKKRDNAARSLEVAVASEPAKLQTNQIKPGEEKWLVEKVNYYFSQLEDGGQLEQDKIDELYVLIGAMKVLGLDGAAQSFMPRLASLKDRLAD